MTPSKKQDAGGPDSPHVFTLFTWLTNPKVASGKPLPFKGKPACFSKTTRLQHVADRGGTIWVVLSEPGGEGQRKRYRLAYKLANCTSVVRDSPWGRYGVEGDPDASVSYGGNNVETVLMAMRFRNAKPIKSRRQIGFRLTRKPELSTEDIARIEEFAGALPRSWNTFLSYNHEGEGNEAIWLERAFQREGKTVFRDGGALRVGQVWNEKIGEAIDDARSFVVLCSDAAADSDFVRDEVERALRSRKARKILPVEMPGASMERWPELCEYHRVKWDSENREGTLQALLKAMRDR